MRLRYRIGYCITESEPPWLIADTQKKPSNTITGHWNSTLDTSELGEDQRFQLLTPR